MPVVSLPPPERPLLPLHLLQEQREVELVSQEGLLLPCSRLLLVLHSPLLASLLPPSFTPASLLVPAPALSLRLLLHLLARGRVEGGGQELGRVREAARLLGIVLPRLQMEQEMEEPVVVENQRSAMQENAEHPPPAKKIRGRPPKDANVIRKSIVTEVKNEYTTTSIKPDKKGSKSIVCKQCNAKFLNRRELKKHAESHAVERNFSNFDGNNDAMQTTETVNEFAQIIIENIEKFDKTEDIIQRHEEVYEFSCHFCKTSFSSRGGLNYHMSTEQCLS